MHLQGWSERDLLQASSSRYSTYDGGVLMDMESVNWKEIGAALAAPFDAKDIEFRPQGRPFDSKGKKWIRVLTYIDARAVQDWLDAIVGLENWSFDFTPISVAGSALMAAKGTLTIHGISKSDIGDAGNTEQSKSTVSDALKRAGVMFGIGRYLYDLPDAYAQCDEKGQILKDEFDKLKANYTKATQLLQAA